MHQDYTKTIEENAQRVFDIMAARNATEADLGRLRKAFNLAREAHSKQFRKGGEPYILHPIAVATIVAEDLQLGVNSVIAAFLHDVVEDTYYTIDDIERLFGGDVAFLVRVVTKVKKDKYEMSLQLDNFKQMLSSLEYDVRALLVKLADRLHNMRTLASIRPDKQMKIAGETDYFYAPLANRLGLYKVKLELENLSFRFRTPYEYDELVRQIALDEEAQRARLKVFTDQIEALLQEHGISTRVYVEYRKPYSIWRKMQKYGDDFNHLKYRHFTEIVYETPDGMTEKEMTLKIYSILTDRFKDKPGGIMNYIDSPKENGYQSFHVKLLADFGRWQEVHISSERMIRDSQLGVVADRSEDNIRKWIDKFKLMFRDIAKNAPDGKSFIESVVTSFYNDDIMTFTPHGEPVVLPQRSTVLDFAYEINPELGAHAKYARVNNYLASIKSQLHRGDVVEIFTDPACHPHPDWLDAVKTYKAKKAIRTYLNDLPVPVYKRCPCCQPIPSEEVIGFRDPTGRVTLHTRNCGEAISLASQQGDRLVSVCYEPSDELYPVTIQVVAVDRYHLFIDLIDTITNELNLNIDSFNTTCEDSITVCTISFGVHSYTELRRVMCAISAIHGVDEVKRKQ